MTINICMAQIIYVAWHTGICKILFFQLHIVRENPLGHLLLDHIISSEKLVKYRNFRRIIFFILFDVWSLHHSTKFTCCWPRLAKSGLLLFKFLPLAFPPRPDTECETVRQSQIQWGCWLPLLLTKTDNTRVGHSQSVSLPGPASSTRLTRTDQLLPVVWHGATRSELGSVDWLVLTDN